MIENHWFWHHLSMKSIYQYWSAMVFSESCIFDLGCQQLPLALPNYALHQHHSLSCWWLAPNKLKQLWCSRIMLFVTISSTYQLPDEVEYLGYLGVVLIICLLSFGNIFFPYCLISAIAYYLLTIGSECLAESNRSDLFLL